MLDTLGRNHRQMVGLLISTCGASLCELPHGDMARFSSMISTVLIASRSLIVRRILDHDINATNYYSYWLAG
jgi:hypothetical protein